MQNVLVIGKNGNLGSELLRQLGDLAVGLEREELDITHREEVLQKITELKPSVVFNCAAFNNVNAAEENSEAANLLNGYAPGFLAEACSAVGAVLVHYSSDYVFNGSSPEGYAEDVIPDPVNAYGRSKLLGEQELKAKTEKYYILRTSWLFGKKGPGELSKPSFVNVMLELAKTKPELKVVSDEQSRPTYIGDLARTSIEVVVQNKPFGIYHVVNEGTASWYELVKETFKIKGVNTQLIPVPGSEFKRAAKRPRYGFLNNTKLEKLRPWQGALFEHLQGAENSVTVRT